MCKKQRNKCINLENKIGRKNKGRKTIIKP